MAPCDASGQEDTKFCTPSPGESPDGCCIAALDPTGRLSLLDFEGRKWNPWPGGFGNVCLSPSHAPDLNLTSTESRSTLFKPRGFVDSRCRQHPANRLSAHPSRAHRVAVHCVAISGSTLVSDERNIPHADSPTVYNRIHRTSDDHIPDRGSSSGSHSRRHSSHGLE